MAKLTSSPLFHPQPREVPILPFHMGVIQGPPLEEWLLGTLRERGRQTLDQLGEALPETNWAQLLLAIDRLSRRGDISMWLDPRGDYLIEVKPPTCDPGLAP